MDTKSVLGTVAVIMTSMILSTVLLVLVIF